MDIADDATVLQPVAKLEHAPGVVYAQPNLIYHVATALDYDPMVGEQRYLDDLRVQGRVWTLQRCSEGSAVVTVVDAGYGVGFLKLADDVVVVNNVAEPRVAVVNFLGYRMIVCVISDMS